MISEIDKYKLSLQISEEKRMNLDSKIYYLQNTQEKHDSMTK